MNKANNIYFFIVNCILHIIKGHLMNKFDVSLNVLLI